MILQLRDLGIEVYDAVRLGLARILAESRDPSSVNMALGVPYFPQLSSLVLGSYFPYGLPPTGTQQQQLPQLQTVLRQVLGGGSQSSETSNK